MVKYYSCLCLCLYQRKISSSIQMSLRQAAITPKKAVNSWTYCAKAWHYNANLDPRWYPSLVCRHQSRKQAKTARQTYATQKT